MMEVSGNNLLARFFHRTLVKKNANQKKTTVIRQAGGTS